jgi:hypothetical protein
MNSRKFRLCPKTGRVMHTSREGAALLAEELSDQHVGVLCAYPCRYCRAYHIGSMSPENLHAMLKEIKTIKEN